MYILALYHTHVLHIHCRWGPGHNTVNDSGVLLEAMLPEVSLAPVKDDDLKGIKEDLGTNTQFVLPKSEGSRSMSSLNPTFLPHPWCQCRQCRPLVWLTW